MIKHRPISRDVNRICKLYSEKDNVPVKYVCTSSIYKRGRIYDIFYRTDGSAHPEFGNRYFGITYGSFNDGSDEIYPFIGNADNIEELEFYVINGVYSRNEHDYVDTGVGVALDGGRDYYRAVGNINIPPDIYHVKDGEFIKKELDISE